MRERCVGIVREVYNKWERRVPLIPMHVRRLVGEHNIKVLIQPCTRRVYSDEEFRRAGAVVTEDLSPANLILGVKQVPIPNVLRDKMYMFFSHTKKAQPDNMALLDDILAKNVTLIDYECITQGGVSGAPRRIAFGRYAGLAGMIEGLRGLGERLLALGHSTPFLRIAPCYTYYSLDEAKSAIDAVSQDLQNSMGLGNPLDPLVFVFTGTGKVTQGALEIFVRLPHRMVEPHELPAIVEEVSSSPLDSPLRRILYGCIVTAKNMVEPLDGSSTWSRQEYYENPESFRPVFHERIAPYTSVLVNGMYWEQRYPRLITMEQLSQLHASKRLRMVMDADLTCDIRGSIEFLTRSTKIEKPFYVFNPSTRASSDNLDSDGVMMMGVDILPSELPREASQHFGDILVDYLPTLLQHTAADPIERLPAEIAGACITAQGKLTPRFSYIAKMRQINEEMANKGNISDSDNDSPRKHATISLLLKGHLFDSNFINQALNLLETMDVRYSVTEIDVIPNSRQHRNESSVVIRAQAESVERLQEAKTTLQQLAKLTPNASASVAEIDRPHGRYQSEAKDAPTFSEHSQKVLILGAGLISGPLIWYLASKCTRGVVVVSASPEEVRRTRERFESVPSVAILQLDVTRNSAEIEELMAQSSAVVSVLPATMHYEVAKMCLRKRVHLITASYVSPQMRELDEEARKNNLTFLNEMGLDPGMDHLSAMRLLDSLTDAGHTITSFSSVCGGLPAPEAANNPLGYKFSWSPRGVLTASKNSAQFLENGKLISVKGEDLLSSAKPIKILPSLAIECLPNRDSLSYRTVYKLPESIQGLFRGTLRYSGFSNIFYGFRKLGLMEDGPVQILGPTAKPLVWSTLMNMIGLGSREAVLDRLVSNGISHDDAVPTADCIAWLGMFSDEPVVHRGNLMDSFCALLEKRLSYGVNERDMALMQHKITSLRPDGVSELHTSTLIAYGEPGGDSAMSRTVGLTAAIGTELILQGKITQRGIVWPTHKEVYEPTLELLAQEGLTFDEHTTVLRAGTR